MPLANLEIQGSVNECSDSVWVNNQVVGAIVHLEVIGASIGGGLATSTSQPFPIKPQLAGTTVTAYQTKAGNVQSSGITFQVGPAPSQMDLEQGGLYQPFYVCGQCLWLAGLAPAAAVTILLNNQAHGMAHVGADGRVEVHLDRLLEQNDQVAVQLQSCQNVKATLPVKWGTPSALPATLATPVVQPPLVCDTSITVSGVTPGAQVTIKRGTSPIVSGCVPTGTFTFLGLSPLAASKAPDIVATVEFPGCKEHTSPVQSQAVAVGNSPPGPPLIQPPCAGSDYVVLDQLHYLATVELAIKSQSLNTTLLLGAPGTSLTYHFGFALPADAQLRAMQSICSNPYSWGSPSNWVSVKSLTPGKPSLFSPPDKAQNEPVDPVLSWDYVGNGCNDTFIFDIEISTDSQFASGVMKLYGYQTGLEVLHLTNGLAYGTKYYWRVRARKGTVTGLFSDPFSFTTVAQNPSDPGGQDDNQVVRTRYFIEDCCPLMRKVVAEVGTHDDALAKARANAGSTCTVYDLEVPSNYQVPPC
jgi:hypothetical protein